MYYNYNLMKILIDLPFFPSDLMEVSDIEPSGKILINFSLWVKAVIKVKVILALY